MADEQDARVLLAEALFSDPKSRPVMEDLIAEKFPKAAPTIPGFQARKAVEAELAELRKLRDEVKSDRESEKLRREIDAEWARVVAAGLVSDEDREEVEKIMAERPSRPRAVIPASCRSPASTARAATGSRGTTARPRSARTRKRGPAPRRRTSCATFSAGS